MKLNKAQIEAIATKVEKEIEEVNKVHNSQVKTLKNVLIFDLIEKHPDFKQLHTHTSRNTSSSNGFNNFGNVLEFLQVIYKDEFDKLPKEKSVGYNLHNNLVLDITLGTIESEDVDGLINSLRKKYIA